MRMQILSPDQLQQVHEATLTILEKVGVSFKGSDEARELFMAHGADGAVGMATITRSESGYELNGVGVLPEHRGKGYGAAIMDACLVVLRNRGVRDVTLEVDAANEPALALYRSRGFAETARVDYWRLPTRCL